MVTTARGTVGSGFSDVKREFLWAEARSERLIGQVIEVSCMEFHRTASSVIHTLFACDRTNSQETILCTRFKITGEIRSGKCSKPKGPTMRL